jgi:hypothetical protein
MNEGYRELAPAARTFENAAVNGAILLARSSKYRAELGRGDVSGKV